jgi:hypothetical protein
MRYYESRTYEHQCDFDAKNRAEKASQDRNLVREQNLTITPEFSKLIGLK